MNLNMRAYPGHQLCGAEELYQIVVRIQAHPPDFIHMLLFGCYHEDWKMQLLPDFPTNLKTAFSGSTTSRILLAPSTFAVLWAIESFSANTNFIRICSFSPKLAATHQKCMTTIHENYSMYCLRIPSSFPIIKWLDDRAIAELYSLTAFSETSICLSVLSPFITSAFVGDMG